MASMVGSGGSIAKTSSGVRMPRWSGRSGWTSTTRGTLPARARASAMAATTSVVAPVWSQCQCDRNRTSMAARSTARRSALASHTSPYGPTSKSTVVVCAPCRAVASAENPWQATQRWSKPTTQSWPSCRPLGAMLPRRYASSGSCGTPGAMLDNVSVVLSTTIVMVSSSRPGGVASCSVGTDGAWSRTLTQG